MNTQTITLSRQERQQFEDAWRSESPRKVRAPALYLLQAVLRGRDPFKGFSPITSTKKLANGQTAWQGLNAARAALVSEPLRHFDQAWPVAQKQDALTASRRQEVLSQLLSELPSLAKGGL